MNLCSLSTKQDGQFWGLNMCLELGSYEICLCNPLVFFLQVVSVSYILLPSIEQ